MRYEISYRPERTGARERLQETDRSIEGNRCAEDPVFTVGCPSHWYERGELTGLHLAVHGH